MPNLGFNPSQGSPSSSYGFSAGAASGSNTSRHVQDENVQPRPSTKRKASEAEGSESRATKKVKKSSRPKLWDNRPECSSDDAAGPLSISQQRRIRAKIAASSTKRETQRAEVIPWQVPEEVEIPKEPVISTTELEVEAVERVSGEQIAAVANNTEVPVPDLSFRKWRNNEEKFKMMAHSTRGGGIDGLIKSRNGNVIRPPNPPVPLVQEPETNTGRGKALSSAQIRKLMQYRNRAPSENKLYKPRYKVSKNFCPGQDPRTLPLNLLNRLWDCEPESVSSSEVAMMKELVRPNAEQIKRRRGRRAARELYAEKVCVFASLFEFIFNGPGACGLSHNSTLIRER